MIVINKESAMQEKAISVNVRCIADSFKAGRKLSYQVQLPTNRHIKANTIFWKKCFRKFPCSLAARRVECSTMDKNIFLGIYPTHSFSPALLVSPVQFE